MIITRTETCRTCSWAVLGTGHVHKPELWTGSWKIRRTAGKCSFRDRYRDRMWIMDGKKDWTCALLRNSNMYRNMDNEKDEP